MEVKLSQLDIGIRSGVFTPHAAFDQFFRGRKVVQCDQYIVVHVKDHLGLVPLPYLVEVEFGLRVGAFVVVKLGKFQI